MQIGAALMAVVAGCAVLSWQARAEALDCPSQYFVYASEQLNLADRSTIGYGSVGAGVLAELGVGSRIQGSLVAESISLRNNALLNGSAYTSHAVSMQQGARILGQTLPISPALVCTAPTVPTVEPGSGDVFVEGTLQLAPGHYSHLYVTPDSTLVVTGGDYHFEVVVFEPDSRLVALWQGQPARFLVSDGVMFGDRHQQSVSRPSSNTNTRAAVAIYSLQDDQLRLGTDSVVYSQIVAPFAEVNVPPRTQVRAPLYGKWVRIEPDSAIGAPVGEPPTACQ